MKKYILVDDPAVRGNLLPLTYTRPVAGLRLGITTIREKWERKLGAECTWRTVDYLQEKADAMSRANISQRHRM